MREGWWVKNLQRKRDVPDGFTDERAQIGDGW